MWLVITDDITTAATLAHRLGPGQDDRFSRSPYVRHFDGGTVVAIEGPLMRAQVAGRGAMADRVVRWEPTRKNATRALAKLAPEATSATIATAPGDIGELTALHALRVLSDAAPRLARKVTRAPADLGEPAAAHPRYRPEVGAAAEAARELDALWEALLARTIPEATRHTLPALGLLSSGPLEIEQVPRALATRRLPATATEPLLRAGVLWHDGRLVCPTPAAAALVAMLEQVAPGLLDAEPVARIDAELARAADGGAPAALALARGRDALRETGAVGALSAPGGYTEARVLGVCPSCRAAMRARLGGDGTHRLTCAPLDGTRGCAMAYPLPTYAVSWPGGAPCSCAAPRVRVTTRGWTSAPRCVAGEDCPEAGE